MREYTVRPQPSPFTHSSIHPSIHPFSSFFFTLYSLYLREQPPPFFLPSPPLPSLPRQRRLLSLSFFFHFIQTRMSSYLRRHFAACFKATKARTRDYEIAHRIVSLRTQSCFARAARRDLTLRDRPTDATPTSAELALSNGVLARELPRKVIRGNLHFSHHV